MSPRVLAVSVALASIYGCGDVRREPITAPAHVADSGASAGGSGGAAARPSCAANDDCPVTAPACDVAQGSCGPCASDADCRTAEPRCDTSSGACVECLDSEDCVARCSGATPCARPEAILCHPSEHRCVECVTDGHCSSVGERCSTALGVCATPCGTPASCPTDEPLCDTIVGFCVGCITDADCPKDTPYCRRSECTR